ncbi:MAG: hypothetical protein V9F05_14185 [Chitinophagaceae bacterium]
MLLIGTGGTPLPNDAPEGEWTWAVELNGTNYEHTFIVGDMPVSADNNNLLNDATAWYENNSINVQLNTDEMVNANVQLLNTVRASCSSANSSIRY